MNFSWTWTSGGRYELCPTSYSCLDDFLLHTDFIQNCQISLFYFSFSYFHSYQIIPSIIYKMKSLWIWFPQVIVGTFFIEPKKDASAGTKGDVSASKLPPPVSESVSSLGFCQAVDPSTGNLIRGNVEHQAIGGSHFMMQQGGMHMTPSRSSDWGGHPDSRNAGFELTGMNFSCFENLPTLPFLFVMGFQKGWQES